jgi:carboxyl-terminal processing protease
MRKKIIAGGVFAAAIFIFVSAAVSGIQQKKKTELYRQIELLSDTLAVIQTDYVDEVSPKDLVYGALKGMVSSLDPYSQFMDPDTYNDLKADTEGKFGGLGIEITVSDGLLTVVTPIEDTPAWKAGIKSGDRIVKISGELTREMSLSDAVKRLRGKPGDAVDITILRESENKVLDFKIVRDIIKIKDIKEAKILEDGIGYIRLIEFADNMPRDFDAALENLKAQGANALILDLRNNPGGLLDAAVKVAENFIENGKLIVYTKGRKTVQSMDYTSRLKRPVFDLPTVVIINEGSASGSEIVAGALQDYRKAIILGTKSFGKGSVQTVVPLSDGSALKITTSKYFTPQGRQIHEKGVVPDIVVEEGKIELAPKDKDEAAEKSKTVFEQIETKPEKEKDQTYKTDNQLMRAIDVLKAVRIYKGTNK